MVNRKNDAKGDDVDVVELAYRRIDGGLYEGKRMGWDCGEVV